MSERPRREKMLSACKAGTYLSSWKIRKIEEALQFVQALVNNKDRSGMSKHTVLTQTQTDTAIVLDQVNAM